MARFLTQDVAIDKFFHDRHVMSCAQAGLQMTMRLSIAFFIPIVSLYIDFPIDELENLLSLFFDEGFGLPPDCGWKILADPAVPFSSVHIYDISLFYMVFSQPGRELFGGKDILGYFKSGFFKNCRPVSLVRLGYRTVGSSIVPRDLSSRNKF